MSDTLLLNQSYEPIAVINWQKSIVLDILSKVDIIEWYADKTIKTQNFEMLVPSIVRLKKMARYVKTSQKYSKENIFKRDSFMCQYCGYAGTYADLTCDHVVPKSKGGVASWKNIVTCCKPCNQKKGSRSLEETEMVLIQKPFTPTWFSKTFVPAERPSSWDKWLW